MKTAGDILSALFDERFMKKAQGYSKLFDSWTDITAKNGIAAAADHSRIKDLDKGILLVEMDHPGWKQIIQTKQTKLLNDFRIRFPELDISGISLMLGKSEPRENSDTQDFTQNSENTEDEKEESKTKPVANPVYAETKSFDTINDEEFKEKLKSLGQTIAAKEKH